MNRTGKISPGYLLNNILFLCIFFLGSCIHNREKERSRGLCPYYDEVSQLYVYEFADNPPMYAGGQSKMGLDFISCFHHDYTPLDLNNTRITLVFVIDSTGTLVGERIENKVNNDLTSLEKDALHAIKQLQTWSCGEIDGKPVNVIMSYPINLDFRE